MENSENIALVLKHLERFADVESFISTLDETVTKDIEWFNSGYPTCHGLDQAKAFLKGFGSKYGGILIECVNISEDGNKVWTERIDYQLDKDGKSLFEAPCMGIFEIENGLIKSWRDYFDTTPFKA